MNIKIVDPRPVANAAAHCAGALPLNADTESWHRTSVLRGAIAMLDAADVETDALLESVGLSRGLLDTPDALAPISQIGDLYASSADALGQPDFGLRAGAAVRLDDLGKLAVLMRLCPTVGDAVALHARLQFLNSHAIAAVLSRRGKIAEWNSLILKAPPRGLDQVIDHIVAATCALFAELAGTDFVPLAVELAHDRPDDIEPYRRILGVAPRFNAPVTSMQFPAAILDRRLAGADAELLRTLLGRIRRSEPPDIVTRTVRAIAMHLHDGDASVESVASELAMHRRSLSRRLSACGTTMQAMIDAARLSSAQQLLAFTKAPIETIALSLGYAGAAPFVRAFSRWTGVSPGRWRAQYRKEIA